MNSGTLARGLIPTDAVEPPWAMITPHPDLHINISIFYFIFVDFFH